LEQARDIILVVHTDGRIIDVNQAALEIYGYSREELGSLRVHDLRAPETRETIDNQLKIAQQNGSLFRTMHMRRSGERFPAEVSSQRVRLTDEDVIVSIVRDITESVAMGNDLRESEAKFRRINEELTAAHEELTASEEELRQQFDELLANQEQIMLSQEALQTSEVKYRAIYEAANDGIYVHDLETGDILDVNETACNLYGYTRDEILTGNFNVIGCNKQ
jgi:PAS domain S-box-containing protein